MMGICPHRGAGCAGFFVFWMGALRWDGRDARSFSRGMGQSSRGVAASDMTSGTWRQPRAVSVRTAETCAGQVLRPYGGDSGAHWAQGRARLNRKLFLYLRAQFEIQTDMQTELRDQKSVWARIDVFAAE